MLGLPQTTMPTHYLTNTPHPIMSKLYVHIRKPTHENRKFDSLFRFSIHTLRSTILSSFRIAHPNYHPMHNSSHLNSSYNTLSCHNTTHITSFPTILQFFSQLFTFLTTNTFIVLIYIHTHILPYIYISQLHNAKTSPFNPERRVVSCTSLIYSPVVYFLNTFTFIHSRLFIITHIKYYIIY